MFSWISSEVQAELDGEESQCTLRFGYVIIESLTTEISINLIINSERHIGFNLGSS
jgi:hypothetical protein